MERGHREKREMIDRLERVRAAIRREDMAPALRAEFEFAIFELERDILAAMPTDSARVLAALAAWVPRLETPHPDLAGVLAAAVAELHDLGLSRGGGAPD